MYSLQWLEKSAIEMGAPEPPHHFCAASVTSFVSRLGQSLF